MAQPHAPLVLEATAILATMSGRYAFSMPEPRQRDGWFRIGTFDVTTTILIVLAGAASMFVYAISPEFLMKGAFASPLVRQGELWRVVTWPLVNPPSLWELIGLAIFWWLGHFVEDRVGRKPFAVLIGAMTVVPAVLVSLIGATNDVIDSRWDAYTFSVSLLTLGLICVFGLDQPNARTFFGIPVWVLPAAILAMEILSDVGARAWAQLILVLLVVAVALIGARQRGLCDLLSFIPRVSWLSGPPPSPYGEIGSARTPKKGRSRRRRGPAASTGTVTQGPWQRSAGPTPLEQAELDVLLDRISEGGIDSLTKHEKARLNELSRRMRDS